MHRTMKKSSKRVIKSQSGIAIPILAVTIVVCLIFAALSFNISYWKVVRGELETAADAAATAGASALCFEIGCYDDALESARRVLSRHVLHGNVGDAAGMDLTGSGPVWQAGGTGSNLRITIQRGRWWGGGEKPAWVNVVSSSVPFEPFDEVSGDWQARHPGLPRFVAANAVYVKIERPKQKFLLWSGGSGEYQVFAEAVAAKSEMKQQCMAPFAVPVCSLMNNLGKIYSPLNCMQDLYFANEQRYCTDPTDCYMLPEFAYRPIHHSPEFQFTTFVDAMIDLYMDELGIPAWPPAFRTAIKSFIMDILNEVGIPFTEFEGNVQKVEGWGDDGECTAANLGQCVDGRFVCQFSDYKAVPFTMLRDMQDWYGVVGAPPVSAGGTVTETYIQEILAERGCVDAKVGQPYSVLAGGLTQVATDDLIWNQIYRADPGTGSPVVDATHPLLKDTDLLRLAVFAKMPQSSSYCQPLGGMAGIITDYMGVAPNSETAGICNSHRVHYDDTCLSDWQTGGLNPASCGHKAYKTFDWYGTGGGSFSGSFPETLYPCRAPGVDWGNSTVWQVPVAVIADASASARPCTGQDTPPGASMDLSSLYLGTEDPPVNAANPYEIIGFIKMNIFDVDVGRLSPAPPTTCNYANERDVDYWGWGYNGGYCNNVRGRPVCAKRSIVDPDVTEDTPDARIVF
jgi:hypothetical protein